MVEYVGCLVLVCVFDTLNYSSTQFTPIGWVATKAFEGFLVYMALNMLGFL